MGYDIDIDSNHNMLPAKNKVKALIKDGAEVVDSSTYLPNMVCVVENGAFDAAAYLYSESEFDYFVRDISRKKTFLTHPLASKLSGFDG